MIVEEFGPGVFHRSLGMCFKRSLGPVGFQRRDDQESETDDGHHRAQGYEHVGGTIGLAVPSHLVGDVIEE